MTKKREKKVLIQGVTRKEAEAAFAEYASADARQDKITAEIELQFTKVREKYQDEFAELTSKKNKAFDLMQAYATENKEAVFSKKKSLELTHGVIGFRTGTPKLDKKKGLTWPAVVILLKKFLPGYVRTIEEVAKDKLISDRDNEGMAKKFDEIGIFVTQDETFFVEPKKENKEEN